jgi:hypothetical protein
VIELEELNELAVEQRRSAAAGDPADRAAAAMVAVTGPVHHALRAAVERIATAAAELVG